MLHHGDRARTIVWEHNTHVGDARFTDMARAGMVNVGQLVRQGHESEGVALVGLATHHGSVEDLIHRATDGGDALFVFDGSDGNYVPTIVPHGYDALILIDETHAVDPLHMPVHVSGEEPDT